jgi:ABC-type taurine transport system substrate-binding protein
MKLLLDIQDHKADFVKELLSNFSFVTLQELTADENLTEELKESMQDAASLKKEKSRVETPTQFLNRL